jgi:hypothetical protein
MRYRHFYEPAITSRQKNDEEALRLWSSTLRRGLSALKYKRNQAAEIYLTAAYEIGALRLHCADNTCFDETHILQPLGQLRDLFISQGNVAGARSFLAEAQRWLQSMTDAPTPQQERAQQGIVRMLQDLPAGTAPAERIVAESSSLKTLEPWRPRRQAQSRALLSAQGAVT